VTVIRELASGLTAGHKVAVRALAFPDAADRLQCGQRAYKPTSLALFESWRDVQEFARSHASRDLLPVVQIIDREGTGYLRQLLSGVTTDEAQADYVA
jgi:hypothetical protein